MSAPSKPLKSALKKSSAPAHASSSKPKAGPSTSSKGKSKGSVTLATKPTRFKGSDLESESEGNASGFENEDEDVEMEMDTDEEIERSKEGKEGKKSGNKRKRSTTTANDFGSTLTSLLSDPLIQKSKSKKPKTTTTTEPSTSEEKTKQNKAIQQPILALSAHKPPAKASVSLEAKARRQLKAEKEEKQDKARVKDVVEGWSTGDGVMGGMEFEKSLRKTAQRGVIKLFNAILLASKNSEAAMTSLSAQAKLKPEVGKKKEKDNILGRGGNKDDVLTKESFLDMVRKGSTR
ncbi:hypothetical protein I302_105626 [Kwoniella bestiolae CBS 10118]|uniref:Rrp15p-domain-containing protein n=1 Tax=Kwoniella bestiolae CBS 10118 TaxID=1296100 RepID=A0A1B9G1N4_9TREE|nr:hypothetical protein I302_04744 [Kwoniella bestiolae CBS 10118]OCF24934.1 hypothetical protein I302_04744 [Kwoniella bestiolae CBS 10118]